VSRPGRAALLPGLCAVTALAGIGVSAYLTVVHYSAAPLVCSAGGIVNCERVLTSPFAVISGSSVPTAAAGVLWFSISLCLALAQVVRPRSRLLATAFLAWSAAGLATVLYLVFVEIVRLGVLCAWCTAAHGLVLLTFLVALTRAQTFESLSREGRGIV
jgi:uncharacterized membrane protein